MNFIKKYKAFFSDIFLNMIGFGIYIASQQLIMFPIIAKNVADGIYANLVMYIAILNVICNVAGGELGNVRLIRNSEYEEENIIGDFFRLLLYLSIIIAIITIPLFIYLGYRNFEILILVLAILMANVRLYASCYYRLKKQFHKVIIQNVCYLIRYNNRNYFI